MAKEIAAKIKLQCPAGQATPAPPVGPALGSHGVNIAQFVKEFNDQTRDKNGLIIPVVITVFKDRTFSFVLKSPPAAVLLKKAAQLASASKMPGRELVGRVNRTQVREIAEIIAQVALYAGMPRGIDANMLLTEVIAEDPERESAEGFFYRFPRGR